MLVLTVDLSTLKQITKIKKNNLRESFLVNNLKAYAFKIPFVVVNEGYI